MREINIKQKKKQRADSNRYVNKNIKALPVE